MKFVSTTINESIFSAPKATDGLNSIFAGDYLPKLYPGHENDPKYNNYKFKIFKNGPFKDGLNIIPRTMSTPADLIIEDYPDKSITIPPIAKVQGNLIIQNCPDLETLGGLFKLGANGDLPVITGNLIIYNCPKLDDLADNVFPVVYGDMTIQNCPKITKLPRIGGPTQGGNVTFLRNGKKLKKDNIKKAYPRAKMIFCSQEDVEQSKIDESMMINEDFSNPVLSLVNDAFKNCKPKAKATLSTNSWGDAVDIPVKKNEMSLRTFLQSIDISEFSVAWDKISPMCGMKFDWADPKSKKEMIYTIKKHPAMDIVVHIDLDGHVDMVYFSRQETAVFFNWRDHSRYVKKFFSNRFAENLADAMDIWDRLASTSTDYTLYVIIPGLDNSNSGASMWNLRMDREKSQKGIILNTPAYYKQCIKDNRERYKKLKAQKIVNSKYDKIFQEKVKIADDLNNQVHDTLNKAYHSTKFLTQGYSFYTEDVIDGLKDLTTKLIGIASRIQDVKTMSEYGNISNIERYIQYFDDAVTKLNKALSRLISKI